MFEPLTQGEYLTMAVREYAAAHGAEDPTREWILSPFDTWEPNPFYKGERHPDPETQMFMDEVESNEWDEDAFSDGGEAEQDYIDDGLPF